MNNRVAAAAAALSQGCEASLFDKRVAARQFGFSRPDLTSPTQVPLIHTHTCDYSHCSNHTGKVMTEMEFPMLKMKVLGVESDFFFFFFLNSTI